MKACFRATAVSLSVLLLIATACEDPSGGSSSSSSSSATSQIGVVEQTGFYVQPYWSDSSLAYSYYLHDQHDAFDSNQCEVPEGSATDDIYCILDVRELDLYMNGVTFQLNVPSGMCPYTQVLTYGFYFEQPKVYSSTVTCDVSLLSDGSVDPTPTLDGEPANGCSDASASVDATNNGVDSNYDYTDDVPAGPNCAVGNWQLTVNQEAGGSVVAGTSVITGSFGGAVANCVGGPAKVLQTLDDTGFPERTIYNTEVTGANQIFTVPAPVSESLSTNLYAANYWTPAAFDSTWTSPADGPYDSPNESSGTSTQLFPPQNTSDAPLALQLPTTVEQPLSGYPDTSAPHYLSPYYEFACLDYAADPIARIRVLVRSWDTVANWTSTANPYEAYSNPSDFDSGFDDEFLTHMFWVWQDYATSTYNTATFGADGSTTYPGNVYPGVDY